MAPAELSAAPGANGTPATGGDSGWLRCRSGASWADAGDRLEGASPACRGGVSQAAPEHRRGAAGDGVGVEDAGAAPLAHAGPEVEGGGEADAEGCGSDSHSQPHSQPSAPVASTRTSTPAVAGPRRGKQCLLRVGPAVGELAASAAGTSSPPQQQYQQQQHQRRTTQQAAGAQVDARGGDAAGARKHDIAFFVTAVAGTFCKADRHAL